ncbi:TLDc domain-containing protein [Entamoeba marina]
MNTTNPKHMRRNLDRTVKINDSTTQNEYIPSIPNIIEQTQTTHYSLNEFQTKETISKLKYWSGKKMMNVIYDSDINSLTREAFILQLLNKQNLYFILFDKENNVFGGFLKQELTRIGSSTTDPNSFVFSLMRNSNISNVMYKISSLFKFDAFYLSTEVENHLFQFGSDLHVCDVNVKKILVETILL